MIPKSLMIYCVVKRAIDYSAYKFIESKQFYKQLFTPTIDFNEDNYFFMKNNDKGKQMGYLYITSLRRNLREVLKQ